MVIFSYPFSYQKDGYFLVNLALKSINLIICIINMVVPGKNDSL